MSNETIEELGEILLKSKPLTEEGKINELTENNELFHSIIRRTAEMISHKVLKI